MSIEITRNHENSLATESTKLYKQLLQAFLQLPFPSDSSQALVYTLIRASDQTMAFARLFFDNEQDFDRVLARRLNPFIAGLQQATGALNEVAGGFHPRFDVVQNEVCPPSFFRLPTSF